MMAEAFACVNFPILPRLQLSTKGKLKAEHQNAKLITPRDFDYSPYFEIIKYPIFGHAEAEVYRAMPWKTQQQANTVEDQATTPDKQTTNDAVNEN